ncbi:PROTEIN SSU-2, ISOFORM B [Ceraceosorus bombacis]|uniref:PROTEIN SSU-2, ISOFORM B n=1 Tax=Ceraceosorus bombacis TaxID=401625 RepID=A0A0P1BPR7_9BASI|nr:PROTEIN SSU-2, ISOFORM B [Ceraceosorus bombacis]
MQRRSLKPGREDRHCSIDTRIPTFTIPFTFPGRTKRVHDRPSPRYICLSAEHQRSSVVKMIEEKVVLHGSSHSRELAEQETQPARSLQAEDLSARLRLLGRIEKDTLQVPGSPRSPSRATRSPTMASPASPEENTSSRTSFLHSPDSSSKTARSDAPSLGGPPSPMIRLKTRLEVEDVILRFENDTSPASFEQDPAVTTRVKKELHFTLNDDDAPLLSTHTGGIFSHFETSASPATLSAVVAVETRSARWRPTRPTESKLTPAVNDLPPAELFPSPWAFQMSSPVSPAECGRESAEDQPSVERVYEVGGVEHVQLRCTVCSGQGEHACVRCLATQPDECFACEGTGVNYKGKQCAICLDGNGQYLCTTCRGSGCQPCRACSAFGFVEHAFTITSRMHFLQFPAIDLASTNVTQSAPRSSEQRHQDAIALLCHKVNEVLEAISRRPGASRPVLVPAYALAVVKLTSGTMSPSNADSRSLFAPNEISHAANEHDASINGQETDSPPVHPTSSIFASGRSSPAISTRRAGGLSIAQDKVSSSRLSTVSMPNIHKSGQAGRNSWLRAKVRASVSALTRRVVRHKDGGPASPKQNSTHRSAS